MGRLVSAVLVTWNSASYLPRCLAGIAGQTHEAIELIVVDNGSSDGSAACAEALAPRATILRNAANLGFSAAVNQALRIAGGELVLLCNPDAFLEPGYVAAILEALDRAGDAFGSAAGLLMQASGAAITPATSVDSKGIRMTRTGRHLDIGQGGENEAPARGLRPLALPGQPLFEVFGVSGAAAVHRMSFLQSAAVDGEVMDEDFFSYREDADLAWRGQLSGWRALYVPHAVAYHVRRVTPKARRSLDPSINMHSVKNRFLLRLKNESGYLALRNAPFELTRDLVTIAAVLTTERTSLPAFSWIIRNFGKVLRKRRVIQMRRRVSDRTLAGWFR